MVISVKQSCNILLIIYLELFSLEMNFSKHDYPGLDTNRFFDLIEIFVSRNREIYLSY